MSSDSECSDTKKNTIIQSDTTEFTSITTTFASSPSVSNDHHPRARLCHLKKWPHFQGYGFNLHAEKHKSGQHIGKVDLNSPAESAGLKEGDRIIEVNNVNISNENHQQVVKRIRNGLETSSGQIVSDEVVLLVVDNEADAYYRSINVIVKSDFKNLLRITTSSAEETVKVETEVDQENTNPIETIANNTLNSTSLSSVSQKSVDNNNNNIPSGSRSNNSNKDITAMSPVSSRGGEAVTSGSNLSVSSHNQSSSNSAVSSKVATPKVKNDDEENKLDESLSNDVDNESENKHEQSKSNHRQYNETSQLSQIDSNQARFYQEEIKNTDNRRVSKNSKPDPFHLENVSMNSSLKSSIYSTVSLKPDRLQTAPMKPARAYSMCQNMTVLSNDQHKHILKYKNGKLSPVNLHKRDPVQLNKFLEMSAAEFKTYLKSKGRPDPRIAQVDMRQKFQMFQDM